MASGIFGSLRRAITGLLCSHHARPHTKFLTVPSTTGARWSGPTPRRVRASALSRGIRWSSSRDLTLVRNKDVTRPANLRAIGEIREAKAAEVRVVDRPSRAAKLLTTLTREIAVTAIGSVAGGTWILIGEGEAATGYVRAADLDTPANGSSIGARPANEQVYDLDALAKDDSLVVEQVAAETTCRTLDTSVTGSAGSGDQAVRACKGGDGTWE